MIVPATGSSQKESAFRRGKPCRGADHERDHEVADAREDGNHEQEDQDRRVDREQPVVGVGRHEVGTGWASWARISSAISPPTSRKKNELTRYWIPITLWSVLIRK